MFLLLLYSIDFAGSCIGVPVVDDSSTVVAVADSCIGVPVVADSSTVAV